MCPSFYFVLCTNLTASSSTHLTIDRLVHVKMLAHVAQSVGFAETNEQIIPLLAGLAVDSERAIKQHLTEQLSLLAKVKREQKELQINLYF